ncbi:unnamed protein product [Periconia digitata]|uniref:C2H2-type domain-containing protein n=1 Tax=Periconia digitata TaxID=1303443 RepID=A0A9W4XTC2_9PLEO|nr:unnamed protein product [Periconia digitata]
MAMYHQYRDLPQIPSFSEDTSNAQWNDQKGYAQAQFHTESDIHYNGAYSMTTTNMGSVESFLGDQPFFSGSLFHPAAPPMIHSQSQNYQQMGYWPSPQYRHVSPASTMSASGTSSYATPNEVHSPHHVHTYGSPDDFTHNPLPYSGGEYSSQTHALELSSMMGGGSISLRDLEYQHEPDMELIVEEVEAVGTEIQSTFPAEPTLAQVDEPADTEAGSPLREAESVQPMTKEEEEEEEPSSDTEYVPRNSYRSRRSSGSHSNSRKPVQRRNTHHSRKNSSPKTGSGRIGKKPNRAIASVHPGKVSTESQISGDMQRHFPCPLSPYGCKSTFISKNEWKRHVSTQHIKLGFWRCDLCTPTVDSRDDRTIYFNDFNRKDLFGQHLRRMHTVTNPSNRNQKEQPAVTENNITEHQQRCFKVLRETPPKSQCLFCSDTFSGPVSWDLRMEHIGRHLEKDRKTGDLQHTDIESWIADHDLERWLYEEGIITLNEFDQWTIGDGQPRRLIVPSN